MEFETLLYERQGRLLRLTLNRPKALNALNNQLIDDLTAGLDAAEADADISVVVLTGAGRAFCAGADLKQVLGDVKNATSDGLRPFMTRARIAFNRVAAFEKPLIAAVNGVTAAGGLELLLGCDLAVAAESAKIGDAHANYGLIPGGGGSIRLPRKIGPTRAKQLLYSGEFLAAATLADWGLLNAVVPGDQLMAEVERMAAAMTAKSPLVLRRMKQLVDEGLNAPDETALKLEGMLWEAHGETQDLKEGLSAFSEKRQPNYTGT